MAPVVLQGDGLPDNVGILVEERRPQTVTDYRHAAGTRLLLVQEKAPAQRGLQPEHFEEVF